MCIARCFERPIETRAAQQAASQSSTGSEKGKVIVGDEREAIMSGEQD